MLDLKWPSRIKYDPLIYYIPNIYQSDFVELKYTLLFVYGKYNE